MNYRDGYFLWKVGVLLRAAMANRLRGNYIYEELGKTLLISSSHILLLAFRLYTEVLKKGQEYKL
jgi:hypothetical protein